MSPRIKRIILWTAVVFTAPFLLITCLWSVLLVNIVNPMQTAFITDFEVVNQTDEPIWITPVGSFHSGGKSVLPQFTRRLPAIPAWQNRDLQIDPGARRRICYDWDDINFSEIVVRDASGELVCLVVDPDPPGDAYYANEHDVYVIDDVASLPRPEPDIADALAPSESRPVFWSIAAGGLIAPFLIVWLWGRLRRLR